MHIGFWWESHTEYLDIGGRRRRRNRMWWFVLDLSGSG
jgi:hypothetical protein